MSYEIVAVRASFCLLVILSRTVLLLFKFWHDARNPYEVVHDRAGCFEK